MPASNPRAPTRKQLSAIFRKDFLNLTKEDKRLIKAFEQLFKIVPDEIDGSIDELFEGQYSWLGPAVKAAKAKAFEQDKEIRDLVEEITTDRSIIARLNGKLGELTKPRAIQSKSAAYQILQSDSGVIADALGGAFTLTLPDATKVTDLVYFVHKEDSSSNIVTVDGFGSQTIEDDLTSEIIGSKDTADYKSDGSGWVIV